METRLRKQEDHARISRRQRGSRVAGEGKKPLTSRSEIYKKVDEKKKSKLKIKHPIISLLALSFILLPIIAYISLKNHVESQTSSLFNVGQSRNQAFEVVSMAEAPSTVSQTASIEENQAEQEKEQEQSDYEVIYHTVQENETIFSISMEYYNDVEGTKLIREWNKLKNGQIQKGQKLEIPLQKGDSE